MTKDRLSPPARTTLLCAALTVLAASACKRTPTAPAPPVLPPGAVAITWADNATGLAGRDFGVPHVVWCPPGGTPAPVIGVEIYAVGSSICTAAVQMRRITLAQGGLVTWYAWPQARVFSGSTREGITSTTALRTEWTFSFEPRIPRHHWSIMEDTLDFVRRPSPPDSFLPEPPMMPPPQPTEPPVQLSWSDNAGRWRTQFGTAHAVICPPLTGGPSRTVWGTDIYTHDSQVCTAALHAGAITGAGGATTLYIEQGLSSYQASDRNGVSSRSYGRWNGSFTFTAPVRRAPMVIPATPVPATWQATARQLRGHVGSQVTVMCPPGDFPEPVLGGGSNTPFSDDSSICTAGVYAGAITFARGGPVRILVGPGADLYDTGDQNGVWTGNRRLRGLPEWVSFTVVR